MERCLDLEIMDSEEISAEALVHVYSQIQLVHRWLGNTRAVLNLLHQQPPFKRVLDIGCGQGGLLLEIRKHLGVEVVGLDLRPAPLLSTIPIFAGNAARDPLPEADVAVCMMLAHHLSEAELIGMIRNVSRSCRRFLILDLVRHPVPLWLFRAFVAPFLGRINALDGQTSIRRAFTAAEMREIVRLAVAGSSRPVKRIRHSVSPLWTRQIVDISWAPLP